MMDKNEKRKIARLQDHCYCVNLVYPSDIHYDMEI